MDGLRKLNEAGLQLFARIGKNNVHRSAAALDVRSCQVMLAAGMIAAMVLDRRIASDPNPSGSFGKIFDNDWRTSLRKRAIIILRRWPGRIQIGTGGDQRMEFRNEHHVAPAPVGPAVGRNFFLVERLDPHGNLLGVARHLESMHQGIREQQQIMIQPDTLCLAVA